jgi:hypothetical protein
MTTRPDDPPFTLTVEAGFDEGGVWVIDARLVFRDGTPPTGSGLLGDGRVALLKAIHEEGLRGRALGATRVLVRMDAGDGPVDITPDGVLPKADLTH